MRIHNFALNAVEVTEPYLDGVFRKEQEYLRSIDCDRLLAGFRKTAGFKKEADPYPGGWEDGEMAGHTLGHYMTALAQMKATTNSKDIQYRMVYIILQLAECQREDGYLFASGEELFDRVEKGELAWAPWYTMHKILSGLICVYRLGNLPQALEVAVKLGMWIYKRTAAWTDGIQDRVLSVEYGGMNDCLYELYRETGKKEFLEAAEKFDEVELFKQVEGGENVLSGKNANAMIPKFLGALNRYFTLGESEELYFRAARSFFDMVTQQHTYITGGNSEGEIFGTPDTLGEKRTQCNCETCNAYNMLKLAEGLYSVTGERKYMDFYERTFFNSILGSQNPETAMTTYFQPMAAGYFKTFSTPFESFWCCTGTGMESFTKLNNGIYHAGEDKLYVNLYLSSFLHDEELKLELIQETDMEHFDSVKFLLSLEEPKRFTLCLRIPDWAGGRFELKVNGEEIDYTVQKGYLILERKWEIREQISLRFFPEVRIHSLPDAGYSAAVTYGPYVLAAGLGQTEMTTENTGVNVAIPTKNVPVREKIVIDDISVREWFANSKKNFVKTEDEIAFSLSGTDADEELLFTPYYKHYEDRYAVYFDYCAKEGISDSELKELTEKHAKAAELAALEEKKAQEQAKQAKKQKEKQDRQDKKQELKQPVKKKIKPYKRWKVKPPKKQKKGNALGIFVCHLIGAVVLLVLLYLFADPVGKAFSQAKNAVDDFLINKLPNVAEALGIQEKEPDIDTPVIGGQTQDSDLILRYIENPEEYTASCVLPEGYRALVTKMDKREYICIEGNGLRAYYPNEVMADGVKYLYLENGSEKAVHFWDYSFDDPEMLCPSRGVYNASDLEQYAFFTPDEGRVHIVDANTFQEYTIVPYDKELAFMADIGAYAEDGDNVQVDTVINGKSYLFSVPKQEGDDFDFSDYTIQIEHDGYTLEEGGLRFDAYVTCANTYVGKVVGKLTLSNYAYVLNRLDFYAYAEEDYADVGGSAVIYGVTLEEAQKERIAIAGDMGESLLIPVREDLKKKLYDSEGFVKNESGEYYYEKDGETVSIKGIDVSRYQEAIDWKKAAASGVEFAIIRLGFRGMGTNGTCELDPYFKQNVEGALAAGIKVGVYFFTQATNVEEAKEEAAFVIENLKGYDITWPVAYDTEEITSYKAARANSLPREVRTACAKAFMEDIAAAGYTPVLYVNTRWSILKLDMGQLSKYDLWYAYYGDSIYYPYHFTMWQYTASGKVDGIKGDVDMNISFVDYGARE
ncbi:MAG: glycoside hydrolase family 127 protein [Lachnospiraceae bacterium]|nr:glycoside hydrolase family 127 protein [Lachnospiraceae bacterium]